LGTGKLPLPWHWGLVDVLRSGSRIVRFKALDEVWGRDRPCKSLACVSQGPAPYGCEGAGRDSNLLNHVLRSGSRVCIKKIDEVVNQRRYGALPFELRRYNDFEWRRRDSNPQPPGCEPCTPNRQSIFVFVGDEVVVRDCRTGIEPVPGVDDARARLTGRPLMYSNRQSPFFFTPKSAQRRFAETVPLGTG